MFVLTKSLRGLFLAALTLLVFAPAAWAQGDSWAVAQRDEAGILKVVQATQKFVDQVPDNDKYAAVILYKENNFRALEEGHEHCINMIFQVQDPAGVEYLLAPWLNGVDDGSERASFLVRGDDVKRFDEGKSELLPASDDQHRDRVRFEFGDLEKGDVVGWSVVITNEGPLFMRRIAALDRFPVIYSSCRIFNDGQANFSVEAHGVEEGAFKLKTSGLVNDRPEKWSANLKMLPASPELPVSGPYPLDTPVFNIAMVESYVDFEGFYTGWVPISGRVSTAGILAAGREEMLEEGGGVDVHASALTTGLATDEEKERAIFEFVRDSIMLLEGDEYDSSARRPAKEILKSKQATDSEKVFLMMAMLDAVGVIAEMGVVRPESWGPLSEVSEVKLISFYTQVVRCGGDLGRVYVPQCGECEPGGVPGDWGKAEVFSPKPGLSGELQAYNEKIRTDAFAESGRLDMRQIQLDAEAHGEKEGWYSIEVVGSD